MKSETKIAKDLTSRLLPNKIGIEATNFAHNLLLTDRQLSNLLEITYRWISNYQKLSSPK